MKKSEEDGERLTAHGAREGSEDVGIPLDKENDISLSNQTTDWYDFSRRSRQSAAAILLILLRLVKTLGRQVWPILLIVLFNPNKEGDYFYLKIFGGIAAFAAVRSIIGWFKFYFYVENEELVIERGVLKKSKLNVPIGRIQTVNFKQNVIHQFFNVVSVEIDTAGSSGNEFIIQAISKPKAEALRKYVESQKKEMPSTQKITENFTPVEEKKKLLLQLSPIDLLKIGVSQNHLRTAGIITLFFWSFLDDIEQAFNWKFLDVIQSYFENDNSFLTIFLMILPFFLVVSFILTLVNSVLRDYNLKFWQTETGFKIQSGLFNKKENSANLDKIQLLIWNSNPLKRIFKLFTLRMSQAASKAVSHKNSINVPGIYATELEAVQEVWFPAQMHIDYEAHNISKLITWRKVLYQGILPSVLLIVFFWSSWGWYALSWLLLIGYVYWWANQFYETWIYEVSDEGLRTNSGVITRTHILLHWYKIQGVRIRQGLYQQRKDVADLIFYTAAGSVTIPYVELQKAEILRDYVIFKSEIDGREWM